MVRLQLFRQDLKFWGRQQLKGGDPMSSEFTAYAVRLVRIEFSGGVTA